jgi:hypothetical protein
MLEERDNGVSLYGLCSSGGPEERSDTVRRQLAPGEGTGYILRLKGIAAALESVVDWNALNTSLNSGCAENNGVGNARIIIRTMYPDVSFSICPNKRYDISTNPEDVVQSGTAFAPLPFDYPMQTQGFRNTS